MESIRRKLLNNIGLKLISLGIAFLMWLAISGDQPVEKAFNVHIEYRNIPKGLEISSPLLSKIDVHVRTLARNLDVSESDISAFVDLRGLGEGEKVIYLTQDNVRVPFGVEVVRINPSSIRLTLERTDTKVVPIQVVTSGKPEPGYEVVKTSAIPNEVVIIGPRSRVAQVARARTEAVSLSGHKTTILTEANVIVEDSYVRILDPKPVQVRIEIQEEQKRIWVRGVKVVSDEPQIRAMPGKVDVLLSVPISFRREIKADEIIARLQLPDNLSPRSEPLTPQIQIISDDLKVARVVRVSPETLKAVSVRRK